MSKSNELSEKWIKASIIGTIWAASEIVLGSFLHNLKVPFSGNVLTAIGIIILISVSYIWTEKGLFWRSGLICALMKTMSPSAVIFGPMIAILSEAFLLEISVRVFGRSFFGYILGAMLAMSWNLFQKIINFILFYGLNMVDLYKNLLKYAEKQLNFQFDTVWLPLIALLIIYCILGILSAVIGIRVGRKIIRQPADYKLQTKANLNSERYNKGNFEFQYSVVWLFADVALIFIALLLLNYTSWPVWSLSITAISLLWSFRYKRALRQLSKPKFWVFFVSITMITAFLFSRGETGANDYEQGLLIGIQMNFRAIVIILGFSVLGTELYNPKIRDFFLKTSFKQLPLALELSFESLPMMISNIPDLKVILKNPVSVIYQIVSQVEFRLAEINGKLRKKVFILTGAVGEGKTTTLLKIIGFFNEKEIAASGIYSPRVIENDTTIGYDVVDIASNQRKIFLRKTNDESLSRIGKYSIFEEGLLFGNNALSTNNNRNTQIIIIDEVGALELNKQGWAASIDNLVQASDCHLLLAVRDSLAEQVIHKWNFRNCYVYHIKDQDTTMIGNSIADHIGSPVAVRVK